MPCYLSQITGADTQLLGIESNVAVKVMKTIDSIEKQIIELAAAAAVLSIALGTGSDKCAHGAWLRWCFRHN